MCAMIPMFLYVSKGTSRGTTPAEQQDQSHSNRESLLCRLKVPLPEAALTLNAWAAGRPLHLPWPHLRASCNLPEVRRQVVWPVRPQAPQILYQPCCIRMKAGNQQRDEEKETGVHERLGLVVDHLWWRGSERNLWLASAACPEPLLETSLLLIQLTRLISCLRTRCRCKGIHHRQKPILSRQP